MFRRLVRRTTPTLPSKLIDEVERLAGKNTKSSDLDGLLNRLQEVLPSLSAGEVARVTESLKKLDDLPSVDDCVEDVRQALRRSCSTFPQDTVAVLRRCVDSKDPLITSEHIRELIGLCDNEERLSSLRGACLNWTFSEMARLPSEELLRLLETLNACTTPPLVALTEGARLMEARIQEFTTAADLIRVLSLPHRLHTRTAVFARFRASSLLLADLEDEGALLLLRRIVEGRSLDVALDPEFFEMVQARIFVAVSSFSSTSCTDAIDALTQLRSAGEPGVTSALLAKLTHRFCVAFPRELHCSDDLHVAADLETVLLRFLNVTKESALLDGEAVAALRDGCKDIPWVSERLLKRLETCDALHSPFTLVC